MSTPEIHPGLEDVTLAETRLSSIDGEEGELVIAGFPVEDLAPRASYEESLYLLFHDRLPTAAELHRFRSDLGRRRSISPPLVSLLREAGERGETAMDALRIGVAAASVRSEATGLEEEALRLIAVIPTIVACYRRLRKGQVPVEPREDLGHAENFLYMLNGEEPTRSDARALETYLNTTVDHGLNASTFAARTIVSTGSDLVSAATAAVGALKGPLHGGAPGPVLEMLRQVHEEGNPRAYVREQLKAGKRLMGFGHRVYRARDPRAVVLSEAAANLYQRSDDTGLIDTARELEEVAVDLLAEHKPNRRLETNVEFYTAVLLHAIGLPREFFTPTFAAARVGGWMAHCLEQKRDNRLVRPRARYAGAEERSWTPLEER